MNAKNYGQQDRKTLLYASFFIPSTMLEADDIILEKSKLVITIFKFFGYCNN